MRYFAIQHDISIEIKICASKQSKLGFTHADEIGLERPNICEDTEGTICPICEKGILKQVHEYLHYEYKNGNFYENPLSNEYEVLSVYLVCQGEDACGSEQVDGYCLSYNKETMEMLYEMKEKS